MAKDWFFTVMADDTQAYGPATKENMDIIRLVFDFSCWLEPNEGIGSITFPVILAEPKLPVPPWQNDYPLDNTSVAYPLDDIYPLAVASEAITGLSSKVEVRVGAGTPGMTYVVSTIVTAATTGRRKQVDCLVTIELPLNPNLVGNMDVDPDALTPPLVLGGDATIPVGYMGRVYVENGTGAPIRIFLPAAPQVLQRIEPVDILGTFSPATPCHYQGAPGNLIDGLAEFVSDIPFDDLIFEWTGGARGWIALMSRYSMLG